VADKLSRRDLFAGLRRLTRDAESPPDPDAESPRQRQASSPTPASSSDGAGGSFGASRTSHQDLDVEAALAARRAAGASAPTPRSGAAADLLGRADADPQTAGVADAAGTHHRDVARPGRPSFLDRLLDGDREEDQRRPQVLPIHRPPGSVAEVAFLAGCTRCGDCIPACPYDALVPAPAMKRGAEGTPMIVPGDAACHLCEDRPCATACEADVIRHDLPEHMGTAQIEPLDCMAWQNVPCSSCVERCPVEGAITTDALVRPHVQAEACVGCGLCAFVCPAPRKAITILGDPDRPFPEPEPQQQSAPEPSPEEP